MDIEKDVCFVEFESFEEIRKANDERKKDIAQWNISIRGSSDKCAKPSLKEEMNFNTGETRPYLGKGFL